MFSWIPQQLGRFNSTMKLPVFPHYFVSTVQNILQRVISYIFAVCLLKHLITSEDAVPVNSFFLNLNLMMEHRFIYIKHVYYAEKRRKWSIIVNVVFSINNLENIQLSSGTSYRRSPRTRISIISAQHVQERASPSNTSATIQSSTMPTEFTYDTMKSIISLVLPCAQWVATTSTDNVNVPMASVVSVPFTPFCIFPKNIQSDSSNH